MWTIRILYPASEGSPAAAFSRCDLIDGAGYACARGAAKEVHDRMPLALGDDCLEDWLDPYMTERETIRQLIKPIPAKTIMHWAVSKDANRVGNDRAELVEPLNPV